MRIRHIINIIIFIVTILIIIACHHISNFFNNCLSVVTNSRCNKSSKKLLLQSAFINSMVAHDKNIHFKAKQYSHIIVAACLNAKKNRLNS